MTLGRLAAALILLVFAKQVAAQSLPPLATPGARHTMSIEAPMAVRAKGFDADHEVVVALPATYGAAPDKTYPVLWLTDGPSMLPLAVGALNSLVLGGEAPELILIGVGVPGAEGLTSFGARRNSDYTPPSAQFFFDGFAGKTLAAMVGGDAFVPPPQKADAFLAFLVDQLRPMLAGRYRMSGEHGLFGHSGGGLFTSYALFARPQAFSRYIIGSPSLNAAGRAVFTLEAAYAEAHDDHPSTVFLGAGEAEIADPFMSAWGVVSSMVTLSETLRLRQYPSLRLTTRIFPGKGHLTVVPDIIAEGIRVVWSQPATTP